MAYLEVYMDYETGQQLTPGDAVSFGRNTDNDVILCDDQVSRHHGRITRHDLPLALAHALGLNASALFNA